MTSTERPRLAVVAVAALVCATQGCGGTTVSCGEGTVKEHGACVPFEPTTCGDGTVLVGNECVPDGWAFAADLEEASEPNDATGAGSFGAPALGNAFAVHGCVTPVDGAADRDVWLVTASEPMVLEVTVHGMGGLSPAFVFVGDGLAQLTGWTRVGLSLSGTVVTRQVYLPIAGRYRMTLDDARGWLTGQAAGGGTACYLASLHHVATPAAVPATLPDTSGELAGQVKVFSYTAQEVGEVLHASLTSAGSAMRPSFVLRRNGQHAGTARRTSSNASELSLADLSPGDALEVVVDPEVDLGLTPQAFDLGLVAIPVRDLPTAGGMVTLTKRNGLHPGAPELENDFLSFDVTAGALLHFDVTTSVATTMRIVRRGVFDAGGGLDTVAAPTGGAAPATRKSFTGQYVLFREPGRYYFLTRDPVGEAGQTYTVTASITPIQPGSLSYGVTAVGQPLPAHGSGFHIIRPGAPEWLEVGVTASDWGSAINTARVTLYDLAGEGWLGSYAGSTGANLAPLQIGTQPSTGAAPVGRITLGEQRDLLVRVQDSGTPGASPTYDLLVRERPHVTLGFIGTDQTVVRTNTDTTAPGATTRYLVTGIPGQRLQALITPTDPGVDLTLRRYLIDETVPAFRGTFNSAGAGVTESLDAVFATSPEWIAFGATNGSGTLSTNLGLNATATAPLPYVDICPVGTVVAGLEGTADDAFSAAQNLPAGLSFSFFGVLQTRFVVASNGFVVLGDVTPNCKTAGCYSNGTLPAAEAPNGFIAPYWDDLAAIRVCRLDEPGRTTLQWVGATYSGGDLVQFQVVLNGGGRIDMIWGPEHQASGYSATVGIESPTGTAAIPVSYNTVSSVLPGTSMSFRTQ